MTTPNFTDNLFHYRRSWHSVDCKVSRAISDVEKIRNRIVCDRVRADAVERSGSDEAAGAGERAAADAPAFCEQEQIGRGECGDLWSGSFRQTDAVAAAHRSGCQRLLVE